MKLTMVSLAVNALWPRAPWQQDLVWWAARQEAVGERWRARMLQVVRRGRA